jgi:hypothetical protein
VTRGDSLPPSLKAPAAALVAAYAGRHSPEVVRRCLVEAHERLVVSARVPDFLPIFAEREVRRHLDRADATAVTSPTSGAPDVGSRRRR